jgi:hypothetical protein
MRHFPPRDLAQLAFLALLLLVVEGALRLASVDRVARRLGLRFLDAPTTSVAGQVQLRITPRERRWVNNVGRVVRRWPWDSSCLRQSLLLGWVLRRREPVLMMGVRREGDAILAHAWVRIDGVDLDPTAAQYAAFAAPAGGAGGAGGPGVADGAAGAPGGGTAASGGAR